MPDYAERSPEEREAARAERERRRARATAPQQPVAPTEEAEPARGWEEAASEDEPSDGWEDEQEPGWEDEHEPAAGTRRVGWRERTSAAAAPPAGRANGAARTPHRRTRRSIVGRGLAVLALLLGAAVIWFCVELFQPFHGSGHGSVVVKIPPNSGARQVGDLLARDGVIASGFFFDVRATLDGDRGSLRAGTYRLKLDMSYSQALKVLTTPPPAAKVTEVTIVPGRTRKEIDTLLRSQGVRGSYLADTRRSRLLAPVAYGAPRSTRSLEGFLFPNTYQLREPISIPALVAHELAQFRLQFRKVGLGYARRKHLTPYDILTIASMVEAEAQTAHDRPLIASVIYNRLADGMPLQIDATTRYATGNYTRPLTQSQLNSRSPYNTRIQRGLPPTPIDSPGLASIEAAAHPARTNFLYFVVKPCGNGEHAFASSYSNFLAEVQRYDTARNARGGRSPEKC